MAGILSLIAFWLLCEYVLPVPRAPDGTVLAFWQFAIPLALQAGQALLSHKKKSTPTPGDAEFKAQSARDAARGGAAEDSYFNYMQGFDANKAATETAGAMSSDWMKQFRRDLEGVQGGQVARGRLDTGYGMQDEDRYVEDFNDSVANKMAQLSMNAAGMNLGARQALGAYGERVTGRGLDLTATRRDQALMDAASRRAMYGQIGGALIGAAGQFAGAYPWRGS
jgi:hypothetical protein